MGMHDKKSTYHSNLLSSGRYEMITKEGIPFFLYAEESEAGEHGIAFREERYGLMQCTVCGHQQIIDVNPYQRLDNLRLATIETCEECGKQKLRPVCKLAPWIGMDFPILGEIVFEDPGKLWGEINNYVRGAIEYPEDSYYSLITTWIMMTWRIRELNVVPYIAFVGPIASGKTYALEVLQQLCYHPIFTVSESPAALVLDIENFYPTLLIDQAEKVMNTKWESGELLYRIVASGYRNGAKYRRRVEGKLENVSFNTFSPKSLASTRVWDSAINSRCYAIKMHEADKVYEIDKDKAYELRRKLLGWSYGGKDMYSLPVVGTNLKGRQRDIAISLLRVLDDCGLEEEKGLIERITEEEWRVIMEEASVEDLGAVIVSIIYDIIQEEMDMLAGGKTIQDVLNTDLPIALDIRIYIDELVKRLGEGASKTRVSRELTALGVTRRNKTGARRYFNFSEYRETFGRLFTRYRLLSHLTISEGELTR